MLIVLSKLLPVFVYPLGFGLLVLAAVLFSLYWRRSRIAATLVAGLFVVLYWFSIEPVSHGMIQSLERRYLPVNPDTVAAAAIVVLGGAGRPKKHPRFTSEFNEAGERIFQGIRLYRAGAAPRVVVSGGGIDFILKGQVEAEDLRDWMVEFGVPDSALLLEKRAQNTYDNARLTRELMEKRGLPLDIVLVTSAAHMPRSAAVYRKAGFAVIPSPVDYLAVDKPLSWYAFLPRVENLQLSSQAIKERIGIVVYWLLGWL